MSGNANAIKKSVKEWLRHADEDLRLAQHAFKLKSAVPYKLIAYHAQQCAEKSLKAYLVYKHIDFPYTHNISVLLRCFRLRLNGPVTSGMRAFLAHMPLPHAIQGKVT